MENVNKMQPDLKKSFYCGDAAGRKTATHKDFTDTDRKFAINLNL